MLLQPTNSCAENMEKIKQCSEIANFPRGLYVGDLMRTMPVTKTLPNDWYNTPNIHMCTIKDFFKFSKIMNFKIFNSFALINKNVSTINSSNLSFKKVRRVQ